MDQMLDYDKVEINCIPIHPFSQIVLIDVNWEKGGILCSSDNSNINSQ